MTSALTLAATSTTPGSLITQDGQLEWRGLLMGAGTPYRWAGLEGWLDSPDVRGQDTDRTDRHGSMPGQLLATSRTVTFSWQMLNLAPAQFPQAIRDVQRASALRLNSDEEPLVVRRHGVTSMVMARCTNRLIPDDPAYWASAAKGALRWRATNPELWQLPRVDASTGLPTSAGGGSAFPLAFPLAFGSGKAGGEFTVTNLGNSEAWPVWRMTGPVPGPGIVNADTGETLGFDPSWTLPAGQTLEVDTDAKTVLIVDSNGNSTNVSRADRLFTRQWFPLLPEVPTRVRFTSAGGSDPAARLRCLFHHTDL